MVQLLRLINMLAWYSGFWLGIIPLEFQQGASCLSNCHYFHLMTSLHLEYSVVYAEEKKKKINQIEAKISLVIN